MKEIKFNSLAIFIIVLSLGCNTISEAQETDTGSATFDWTVS